MKKPRKAKPFSVTDVPKIQTDNSKGFVSYRFTLPLFAGTTVLDLIALLLRGHEITMTFEDNSKKKIVLENVPYCKIHKTSFGKGFGNCNTNHIGQGCEMR